MAGNPGLDELTLQDVPHENHRLSNLNVTPLSTTRRGLLPLKSAAQV
jgi:hypothetical protein